MNNHIYILQNILSESIAFIWYSKRDKLNLSATTIPFLNQEFLFNFGSHFSISEHHQEKTGRLIITGIHKTPIHTIVKGKYEAVGIMLNPWGFYQLFNINTQLLNTDSFSLTDIFGNKINELYDAIKYEKRVENKVQKLEQFLLDNLNPKAVPENVLKLINETFLEPLKKGRIKKYLFDINQSLKRYINTFKSTVGLSPRTYMQLVQVNKSLRQIVSHPSVSLTEVAYENGFYDQAHFIRIFKKFSNITPFRYKQLVQHKKAVTSFPNTILN